ncbi:MAG: enoyl-CoA hydratase/isomerase family protein [Bacteroidetes bacterium]|nr:enoyl-CoA hydratase/isomerase family protein [Bacteroidota bacterium]
MVLETLLYEIDDGIAVITINRPDKLNALNARVIQELSQAFHQAHSDDAVKGVVLTGAGEKSFVAGADIQQFPDLNALEGHRFALRGQAAFNRIEEMPKPVVAAVNGYALGGGLELALSCDVIVAAEHAELGLPEPRVGLYAGAGGVHRLPRHIPLKVAMGMMLTGRRIKAQEALQIGLVNEVVPLPDLMPAAERWAAEMLECAPLSLRASKQMALQGLDWPFEIAFSRSYSEQQRQVASADRIEGPRAFAEKRTPNWTGT